MMHSSHTRYHYYYYATTPVLDSYLQKEISELRALLNEGKRIVLIDLDGTTTDICDCRRPMAAGELLRRYNPPPKKNKSKLISVTCAIVRHKPVSGNCGGDDKKK